MLAETEKKRNISFSVANDRDGNRSKNYKIRTSRGTCRSLTFFGKFVILGLFDCYLCCSVYCLCLNVYCHRVTTQLQLINIIIIIIIIIYIYVCVCVCVCVYIYIYIYIHINLYGLYINPVTSLFLDPTSSKRKEVVRLKYPGPKMVAFTSNGFVFSLVKYEHVLQ
jgi:hypothetical protein